MLGENVFFVPIALIIGLDSAFFIYSETQSGMTWTQIRRGHGSRELDFDRASSQYGSSTRVHVPMNWALGLEGRHPGARDELPRDNLNGSIKE